MILREIHLALVTPFRTSAGTVAARRILLLELTDRDGTVAWSECVAEAQPTYSPDTVDTCWMAIVDWLADRVLGRTFESPGDMHAALAEGIRGHRMARAAIEMGAWGLESVRQQRPLATILADASAGGRAATRPVPREHVESGIALGMSPSIEILTTQARTAASSGYRRIKLKVAPGHDVEPVKAVRAALGPSASLSVDANGSYALEDPTHLAALEALDSLGLAMIEQPLAPDDLVRHAELQRRLKTPVCLDESITGLAATEDMLTLGSARIVNIKAGRVGGLTEAIAIHDRCVAAGVPVWCGGMLESGIGRAYNVALASLAGFTEPGDLSPSARYWTRDIVTPEWTMDGAGRVRVPLDRPGIGVEIDTGFVGELTVRQVTLSAR
jgi:O-succinylbenzoate synthase